MNVCEATAKRINQLLKEKGMTQYRLEQKSGILHGSMACIMNGRNKTVTLSTIYMLARGFDMSIIEFLNNEIFLSEEVDFEWLFKIKSVVFAIGFIFFGWKFIII